MTTGKNDRSSGTTTSSGRRRAAPSLDLAGWDVPESPADPPFSVSVPSPAPHPETVRSWGAGEVLPTGRPTRPADSANVVHDRWSGPRTAFGRPDGPGSPIVNRHRRKGRSLLHRALASLLCALGAAALGLGIASATVWRPSDTLVAQAQGAPGTSLLVTDPGVLDLAADEVTVRASATSGTVVIALGRSADVDAWVGDDAHTRVTGLAGWHVLATEKVAASAPEAANPPADAAGDPSAAPAAEDPAAAPAAPDPSAAPAAEDPAAAPAAPDPSAAPAAEDPAADAVPDPAGSDLWVDQASGERAATLEWTRQDGRWSVLVAATAGGVPSVALEWPQVVTTPWLVPGVVVGSLLLLIGIAWWVLILVAGRRRARVAAAPVPEPAALAV